MNDLKLYIIRIIIVASIVQLGTVIIGPKYKKIYSFAGAVFIVFAMLSIPNVNVEKFSISGYSDFETKDSTVSELFTNAVSQKVEYGIYNTFGIETIVDVLTDNEFTKIEIIVKCKCSDEMAYRIEEYVTKTFCTQRDEVVVLGE
jgi:hypothetical protein